MLLTSRTSLGSGPRSASPDRPAWRGKTRVLREGNSTHGHFHLPIPSQSALSFTPTSQFAPCGAGKNCPVPACETLTSPPLACPTAGLGRVVGQPKVPYAGRKGPRLGPEIRFEIVSDYILDIHRMVRPRGGVLRCSVAQESCVLAARLPACKPARCPASRYRPRKAPAGIAPAPRASRKLRNRTPDSLKNTEQPAQCTRNRLPVPWWWRCARWARSRRCRDREPEGCAAGDDRR